MFYTVRRTWMVSMVMRERLAYRVHFKRHPTWALDFKRWETPAPLTHTAIFSLFYDYYCFAIVWLSESVPVTLGLVSG